MTDVTDVTALLSAVGPLQNRPKFERVLQLLDETERDPAAQVVCGGSAAARAWVGPGYFVPPTVVTGLDDTSALVTEEQFGPLLPVLRFEDVDEVIDRANAGAFGLAGSVWTADVDVGSALARRLAVGTAWVNQHGRVDARIPLPGVKESMVGVTCTHRRGRAIDPRIA